MEKLRRVHRAAARLIGGFRKFDHIPLYAECVALASIPTTHLLQDRVLGVAVLVRLGALLSARALPSSLLMFRPSCTPILCSRQFGGPIRPLCDNANLFIFCGWSKNLEWTSSRSKAPSKRCLFSIPPPSKDCSFPLGLGRERL